MSLSANVPSACNASGVCQHLTWRGEVLVNATVISCAAMTIGGIIWGEGQRECHTTPSDCRDITVGKIVMICGSMAFLPAVAVVVERCIYKVLGKEPPPLKIELHAPDHIPLMG